MAVKNPNRVPRKAAAVASWRTRPRELLLAPVATPATPATPVAQDAPALGSAAWWSAEVARLQAACAQCAPASTSYSTLSAGIRDAVRQYSAALAAEPKPAPTHPADEAPEAYRARLEAAAAGMTSEELEPFAAELLRRHAHRLTCDPQTGRLTLAPMGA
jgi:hypothetical protein